MPAELNGRTIVITRPRQQAHKLAALITAAGGNSVIFPLIEIASLPDYSAFERKLEMLPQCQWAIFISSNAVQNAMPRLLQKFAPIPPDLRFAAIGPTTAAELAKFGVHNSLTPRDRFDSEALLALSELQSLAQQRVMIFRGIGGRDVLADNLKARGALVDFAECYRRINPQSDAGVLLQLWQNRQLDALVVTSSEAMRHLLQLADNGRAGWLRSTLLCVNHARIAELPQQLGLRLAVADAPGDAAMLQCLTKMLA